MKYNTHQAHTQSSQLGEYEMMITTAKLYSGTLEGLKFPDICLTGEEKPRKNLTQETCPDRGSNPGPLRDKRSCYHLLQSGGYPHNLSEYSIYFSFFHGRLARCRAHSSIFPSLHLRHSSFSSPSIALPTSQLILQPSFRFSYVTGSSLTSPDEPPMLSSTVNYHPNVGIKLLGT